MSADERLAFVERVLRATEDADCLSWTSSYWQKPDDSLEFYVRCNDFFWWATSDSEQVTPANVHILEESMRDAKAAHDVLGKLYGGLLFCARARKMRPQGAYYDHLPKELWPLFDAAGPERDADREAFGNPVAHP